MEAEVKTGMAESFENSITGAMKQEVNSHETIVSEFEESYCGKKEGKMDEETSGEKVLSDYAQSESALERIFTPSTLQEGLVRLDETTDDGSESVLSENTDALCVKAEHVEGDLGNEDMQTYASVESDKAEHVEGDLGNEDMQTYASVESDNALVLDAESDVTVTAVNQEKGEFDCSVCGKSCSSSSSLRSHYRRHWERPHVCQICNKAFLFKCLLKNHMHIHNGTKPFQCPTCSKGLSSSHSLTLHMRSHSEQKYYNCHICGKGYNSPTYFKTHMLHHKGEKAFSCGVCEKKFYGAKELRKHMICHLQYKPYKCQVCKKAFKHRRYRNLHQVSHTGVKKYKCEVCKKAYFNRYEMRKHSRLHTEEAPFRCDLCGRAFSSRDNFNVHYNSHTGVRPWKCKVCKKGFTSQSSRNRHHQVIHVADRFFKCDVESCGKVFCTQRLLDNHVKVHKPKEDRFYCGECSRAFMSKARLETHLEYHVKSGRSFNCNICNRLCFTQSQLDKHLQCHQYRDSKKKKKAVSGQKTAEPCLENIKLETGIEPNAPANNQKENDNSCPLCDKPLTKVQNVALHMRSRHPGQMPFKCDMCDQAFVVYDYLVAHFKKQH